MLEFFAPAKNSKNFYPNKIFYGLILIIVVQTMIKKIKTKCPRIFFNFIVVNFTPQRKINNAPSLAKRDHPVQRVDRMEARLGRGGRALAWRYMVNFIMNYAFSVIHDKRGRSA